MEGKLWLWQMKLSPRALAAGSLLNLPQPLVISPIFCSLQGAAEHHVPDRGDSPAGG